ncbi:hypothetical protein A9G45_01405 [Gilliamella sp. HK2]|jgi:hypothetical protein|uniref:hypothetical protein n=1 Tax=unclassified Gilliamella TaxID=2685620 RepID=UPI00080ED8F5|nr:hypothetical protein [Gilliamella apicola]OCG28983.1 hypothetical protein A9G46_01700 [Gilliamella apicola]OCG31452.1 hypothetical protein A9G45_01405 [Gilliamella apicola]
MKTEDDFVEFAKKTIKKYMNACNNNNTNMTIEENVNAITALISSALEELESYTSKENFLDFIGIQ